MFYCYNRSLIFVPMWQKSIATKDLFVYSWRTYSLQKSIATNSRIEDEKDVYR